MAIEKIKYGFELIDTNALSIYPVSIQEQEESEGNNVIAYDKDTDIDTEIDPEENEPIIQREEIKNDSIYTITLSGIKSLDGTKKLKKTKIEIITAVTPMYCTLQSLSALVQNFNIPEKDLLIYIRDASKYADFISGNKANTSNNASIDFAKEQFTKTKAVLDCLVRGVVQKSYSDGSKYTLDVATYEERSNLSELQKLIDALKKDLLKWQDAIRGYYNEGRVAPVATRIGIKSNTNSEVSHTTVDTILNDFTRTPPEGS